ncbi:uncharacterized protein N7518_001209 [Penicillium psychrosexuale]|uniref:uncharacterized protein n=1 Tax=Penicillium psychrosexuale TaxID=1002107 RepID=UPI0025453CDD|nr:uncharacterized protein N7518_001209 [Penicillium psychrosexuale]KAJ5799141.1 hypothetical protein N7518_001209 [Penicillium psychrosexuale]
MSLELARYSETSAGVGSKVPNVLHHETRYSPPSHSTRIVLVHHGKFQLRADQSPQLEPESDPAGIYRFISFPCDICTEINTVGLHCVQDKRWSWDLPWGDHWIESM